MSIFSECEEIKGSEEGAINYMIANKQHYASKIEMNQNKNELFEIVSKVQAT